MRRPYPTVRPAAVHCFARRALAGAFEWRPFGRAVRVTDLLDLLVLMAATARTLFAVARRHFPFSHETARQAIRANRPSLDALTVGLADALHRVLALTRRDRRRRWTVALDTHYRPYYGDRSAPGVVGGPKKQGTKFFHAYATAVLLHKRRRYTVGILPLTASCPSHTIVAALLDQIAARGLRVGGVVLDSGFDSGETLLELQRRGLSYTVPLRRKGRGTNRRNACFAWPPGTVGTVAWVTEEGRRAVETRVLVWQRRGQERTKVYAFAGWGDARAVAEARRAWLARRRYRERFGIETSYRQKNQARAWTTSGDVVYRLLLEGVAHLLRQLWVRLTEQAAREGKLRPTAWVGWPLADLLEELADVIKSARSPQRAKPMQTNPLEQPPKA
jgi:hypothetical protein